MSPFSVRGNPGPRVAAQKGRGFFLTSSSPGMLRGAGTRIPVASSESILVLGRRGVVYDATAGGSGQSDPGTPATRGLARAPRGRGDSSTLATPGGIRSRRCLGDLPLHGAVRGTPPRHAVRGSVVSLAARRVDSIRSFRQVPCDLRPEIPALQVASVVLRGRFGGTPSRVGFPYDLIRPAQTVLPDGVEWEEVLPAP